MYGDKVVQLTEKQLEIFRKVLASDSADILELAKLAQLPPARAFRNANLRGVKFGEVKLANYDFRGADIRGADLSAANIEGAIFDDSTIHDATTKWPSRSAGKVRSGQPALGETPRPWLRTWQHEKRSDRQHRRRLTDADLQRAMSLLDANDWFTRQSAARDLKGFVNRPEISARLIELTKDPSWAVRLAALEALADQLARQEVRAAIERLLDDANPQVRDAARATLSASAGIEDGSLPQSPHLGPASQENVHEGLDYGTGAEQIGEGDNAETLQGGGEAITPLAAGNETFAIDRIYESAIGSRRFDQRVWRFDQIVERLRSYDPTADEEALQRAYAYSLKMHGARLDDTGSSRFSDPVAVAGILVEMKLDSAAIIAGILHDIVSDTSATLQNVQALFGDQVATLVDGVSKLARIDKLTFDTEALSKENNRSENFRKLLLSMSEDVRVIFVKLAVCLNDIRGVKRIGSAAARQRIAKDILEIYAPLAERIGVNGLRDEFEDLAFAELYPSARDGIVTRMRFLREDGSNLIERTALQIRNNLDAHGIQARISGREKTPYGIWRKMQMKNVAFEQLSDLLSFRIIVKAMADCYQVLGAIHSSYPTVPGRFKDYISTPKPNGYRSLHTSIIGPERQRIEIVIRTREMDVEAEIGVAARWEEAKPDRADVKQYRWIRELLEIVDSARSPAEYLEHTKLSLFQDQVFCFTPIGDLIALPQGATPVDFAYAIHSEVGEHCVGAKINGRIVPLNARIANGDEVEIMRSSDAKPESGWQNFVVTKNAKTRLRRYFREQQRAKEVACGKQMITFALSDSNRTRALSVVEAGIIEQRDLEELWIAVARGERSVAEVIETIGQTGAIVPEGLGQEKIKARSLLANKPQARSERPLSIRGVPDGLATHFARCCHPLPGDNIRGVLVVGKGVVVHTMDCQVVVTSAPVEARPVDLSWAESDGPASFVSEAWITVVNDPGSLGTLSTVVGRNGGNITGLRVVHRNTESWELLLTIETDKSEDISRISSALLKTKVITTVRLGDDAD
jgi:GTP pyrophosphokinase